jgi:hypothetical protein
MTLIELVLDLTEAVVSSSPFGQPSGTVYENGKRKEPEKWGLSKKYGKEPFDWDPEINYESGDIGKGILPWDNQHGGGSGGSSPSTAGTAYGTGTVYNVQVDEYDAVIPPKDETMSGGIMSMLPMLMMMMMMMGNFGKGGELPEITSEEEYVPIE